MRKKLLNFSSAYSQLILMVFLPIGLLAAVGAYLVEKESSKAIKSEQRTLATAALIRYEPMVKPLLPVILNSKGIGSEVSRPDYNDASVEVAESSDAVIIGAGKNERVGALNTVNNPGAGEDLQSLDDVQNRIRFILSTMNNSQHIQRVAIVNELGKPIASSGEQSDISWENIVTQKSADEMGFIDGIATKNGTAYGRLLEEYEGSTYWLFVEMDDEPLTIALLKVLLGLGVTGLSTLLILLLSLNVYAKRWIAPIYDLRLHLQKVTPENMYQPVYTNSSGELNQLQQDLLKTLRRLYGEFQDLKDYSDQTEEDLRDAFDEMEMQNILIREARDQAISSSQAKSAFLANISHELRTPLNSIDGFINLLARHGNLTAEQDLYVQTIRKSSAHLLALVNDVLDFSKIEAGKLVLDKHEFSLYSAIYDVMDMLSPLAAEKGLRMAVMYYNDVPDTIIGDALRVKQVLTNLVGNAIKFTDVGEVVVRVGIDEVGGVDDIDDGEIMDSGANVMESANNLVSGNSNSDHSKTDNLSTDILRINSLNSDSLKSNNSNIKTLEAEISQNNISSTSSSTITAKIGASKTSTSHTNNSNNNSSSDSGHVGDMIHIAIQDTGHGISDKAKTQLFKSFSQGDPSVTRQYGGTGLGLVISKQLIRLMDGQIGFYDNNSESSSEQITLAETSLNNSAMGRGKSRTGATFWFSIPSHTELAIPDDIDFGTNVDSLGTSDKIKLPVLRPFAAADSKDDAPFEMLVWINHASSMQVFMAAVRPLNIKVTTARSLAGALEKLKEGDNRWDWVVIDGGDSEVREDRAALLKQIRLHYQGKLAIYGYQVALDANLLERYKALGLYQPLDKRQLYRLLDARTANVSTKVASPTWEGVTILAVDDHLPNLLVLDALLSELGINVVTASSGYDAVDIINKQIMSETYKLSNSSTGKQDVGDKKPVAKQGDIDLIFMDLQMPRMSGDEAAKKIRQLEKEAKTSHKAYKKHIPIIALTAHGLADGKENLILAGIDDYVGKPISRPQLLQILQRWLGKGITLSISELKKNGHTTIESEASKYDSYSKEVIDSSGVLSNEFNSNDTSNNETQNGQLVVDWKDALVRSANKPDLAKQLLTMMQESVPEEIVALEASWEMRDREELAQIAHRILGASRYSGVPQIRQASQNFEDKCLLNVQHTIPSQFAMLEEYYNALVSSLKNLQELDLETYITEQVQENEDKVPSENDMTWKMI